MREAAPYLNSSDANVQLEVTLAWCWMTSSSMLLVKDAVTLSLLLVLSLCLRISWQQFKILEIVDYGKLDQKRPIKTYTSFQVMQNLLPVTGERYLSLTHCYGKRGIYLSLVWLLHRKMINQYYSINSLSYNLVVTILWLLIFMTFMLKIYKKSLVISHYCK